MTQIVEISPRPDVSPAVADPEWPSHSMAPSPSEHVKQAPEEGLPIYLAPPPVPWPRVFPGL